MRLDYLKLIPSLIASVMGPEKARFKKLRSKLVEDNMKLGGNVLGFRHLGLRYSNNHPRDTKGVHLPAVEPSFKGEVQRFEALVLRAERDEQRLRQSLTVVLPMCESLQDIRDVLPEVFVTEITQLSSLVRTREAGYILREHPVLKTQYDQAVEIALFYTVNRLVF
jgi:hypothetical protein